MSCEQGWFLRRQTLSQAPASVSGGSQGYFLVCRGVSPAAFIFTRCSPYVLVCFLL